MILVTQVLLFYTVSVTCSCVFCYTEKRGINPLVVFVKIHNSLQTASGPSRWKLARHLRTDNSVLTVVNVSPLSQLIYQSVDSFNQGDRFENVGKLDFSIT